MFDHTPFTMIFVIAAVIWALPILLIAASPRVRGKEKAIWIFAVAFVSWLAWVLYLFVAPVMEEHPANDEPR